MRRALGLLALVGAACGPGDVGAPIDTGLDGLALHAVAPRTLVPGSGIVATGRSFVGAELGATRLRLRGAMGGVPVDVALPARFEDYDRMAVDWPGGLAAGLPAEEGVLAGEAIVEVDSLLDGRTHASTARPVTLTIRAALEPRLDSVHDGVIFVNEPIVVEGDGLLLGGAEGRTVAEVAGCFRPTGAATCAPITPRAVPVRPENPFDRTRGAFPFDPRIAGILPGSFEGTVTLRNLHGPLAGEIVLESAPLLGDWELVPPAIFSRSPGAASLGQYVEIRGGGFVGPHPDDPDPAASSTLLEIEGELLPGGGGPPIPVELILVPEFVAGPLVRYVMNEEDDLGALVDLRRETGRIQGRIRPVVSHGADTIEGDWRPFELDAAWIRQVIWIQFLPSYVESLRHFGLRAVDARIRDRVFEVARRDYTGVNVDFRDESPEDFALYSRVDISGPDLNGLGLLGYDNTPGKDVDNVRLYDKIGGVNATTQEDGYPGYGGVFVESFFGFSEHPGSLARRLDGADAVFDRIFDPFRPDRGGRPVATADLAGGAIPGPPSGDGCPADGDRPAQIACAIWALGSMIGTTTTHEIGHSLGLANPYGQGFHNPGDLPNRLMDAGSARTFRERAELMGEGPAVFCDEEYAYLRAILPTDEPAPPIARPPCQ
jgi:hypothetical protein